MFIVYDILYLIFALLYFPYVILRKKWHSGFKVRAGFFSAELKREIGEGKKVWIHAVSVGEVMAVVGLIHKIQEKYPGRIVLTTVTQTGYQLAKVKLGQQVSVVYAPLDFSFIVRKFVRLIQPCAYITAETEIWPNLFCALFKHQVPVILVNGRLSDSGFRSYRMVKILLAPLMRQVSAVCTQTDVDAQRFINLGARPTSVFVSGNFKFDDVPLAPGMPSVEIQLKKGQLVWIAGSTHPGEEAIALEVLADLQKEFPGLRLIIAPRHVERTAEVTALIVQAGFKSRLFSQGVITTDPREVVLVDTIGQLRALYAMADVVFMGKSLMGQGGQNILEPAFFRKPVIVGPHMQNFRKIVDVFLSGNGLVQVQDKTELLSEMRNLLFDEKRREQVGTAAFRLIERNQGATQRAFEIILRFLPI